jgi:hypothetical protein
MNLDISHSVRAFREILLLSWDLIKQLSCKDLTESYLDDWMQANWEFVVEASIDPSLNIVLQPYGDGADCNIKSSRVWSPHLLPNTPVYVRYIGNDILTNAVDGSEVTGRMKLSHFVTVDRNWPTVEKPFDYVMLEDENMTVIPVDNLEYYVRLTPISYHKMT